MKRISVKLLSHNEVYDVLNNLNKYPIYKSSIFKAFGSVSIQVSTQKKGKRTSFVSVDIANPMLEILIKYEIHFRRHFQSVDIWQELGFFQETSAIMN
jgi:hypothetical protein